VSLRIDIDDIECDGDAVIYQGKLFTGILYELFSDGTLAYEEEHTNGFPNGFYKVSGYCKYWWQNGNKKSENIYSSEEEISNWTEWYENGSLKEFIQTSKTEGILHKKRWNINGVLIEEY
jgi:antitoxin component YwqK of YwqJK toxin-antitoxin module